MKRSLISVLIVVFIISALACVAFGQGKGKGNSGNKGKGNSGSVIPGSGNSDGSIWDNSDNHRNKGNKKSGNDNDDSILGNRGNHGNSSHGQGNSNRFKGLAKKTGISPEALQARYEIEKRLNPDLTYGQFVAAHMVAKNHRGISTGDILGGLRNNRSIGQVLQDKGWDKGKIDKERKRIKKDRDKDKDGDYDDNDDNWRLPF